MIESENNYYDDEKMNRAFTIYYMAFGEMPPRLMETDPSYKPYIDYLLECAYKTHKKADMNEISEIYGDSDLVIKDDKTPEQEFIEGFKRGE